MGFGGGQRTLNGYLKGLSVKCYEADVAIVNKVMFNQASNNVDGTGI